MGLNSRTLSYSYISDFMDNLMKEFHDRSEGEQIHHYGKPHIPVKDNVLEETKGNLGRWTLALAFLEFFSMEI